MQKYNFLSLEDSPQDFQLIQEYLREEFDEFNLIWAKNKQEFEHYLNKNPINLVISDYNVPDYIGTEALKAVRNKSKDIPFIMVSGAIGEENAIQILKKGATDCILKHQLEKIGQVVKRALREAQTKSEKSELEQKLLQSQKMESIGRLAGGVAHDFNNKLAVINISTQILLKNKNIDESIRSGLETILLASNGAADLTKQLLAFSRKQIIRPESINVNDSILKTLKMVNRLIGEDIEIELGLTEDIWPIYVDPGMLDQIIMNLCINSRDAMPSGGKIKLTTKNIKAPEHLKDCISIEVEDSGEGISAENLNKIFDPFYTSKKEGRGTGLGLSTVHGIVKQHHGDIKVESKLGEGTKFTIFFPKEKVEKIKTPLTLDKTTVKKTNVDGLKIIFVEDEELLNKSITNVLREKHDVCSFFNPQEALEEVQNGKEFDLLITDVVLPKMSGKKLSASILRSLPNIKIIFTSGYTSNVLLRNKIKENEVHFIQKPLSLESLEAKINEVFTAEKRVKEVA